MRKTYTAFILPGTIVLLVVSFYPILYAFYMSLFDFSVGTGGVSKFIGLENFRVAITDERLLRSIGRSLIHTGASVGMHFLVGMSLALLLNQQIPGRNIFRALLMTPWILTPVVGAVIWVLIYDPGFGFARYLGLHPLFSPLGVPNAALWAIVGTFTWKAFPLQMVMLFAGLQTIPKQLYEAARIDGAGRLQSFFYVTLPSLRGVIFTVILLDIIWTFRLFDFHFIMTDGGPMQRTEIIPVYLYKIGFQQFQLGRAASFGIIMFFIMFLISIFYVRQEK